MSDERDTAGRFRAGHRAPAGSGRPRGFRGLAKLVAEETRDGAELAEFVLGIFRDPDADPKMRWDALTWLSDRGFGKPIAVSDMSIAIEAPSATGLPGGWAQLTREDREHWLATNMPKALASGED